MAVLIREDQGLRFDLYRTITRIGSAPHADIQLSESDVASEHAHITRSGENFTIASMGRGRPVLVNGKKSKKSNLNDGDRLQIGDVLLLFSTNAIAVPDHATPAQKSALEAYGEIVAFSERLMQSESLDGLLTALMDRVVELSGADKGFLILFEAGESQVRVARNIAQEDLSDAIGELSDSIVEKVIREKQALIVSDALHDQEFSSSRSIMNLKICSVLCVPLLANNDLLGLIYLGNNRFTHLFDGEILAGVTVFAAQASLLLRNALLLEGLRADNDSLRKHLEHKRFGEIIGTCPPMQDIYKKIRKVAPTDISVLVTGETGTGKELIARELHRNSTRSSAAFVVVNCGAIPDNLLESELFGHVKGAFTGAIANKDGRFQAAHKGTLFLDEIGEMPAPLQVKLLRALQEKEVTRVGSTHSERVDIRIVAATNRVLEDEIQNGNFREDLYYRLNVVGLHLPPLRERGDDLMLIARFLLSATTEAYNLPPRNFSPQATVMLKRYTWPGNIRQLENRIKKAAVMNEGGQISCADLDLNETDLPAILPLSQAKDEFQRDYINEVLTRNNGNRTKTAQDLGVDPRTIFRQLEKDSQSQDSDDAV